MPEQKAKPEAAGESLLDRIKKQVNQMDPAEVKAQLAKIKEQRAKQRGRTTELTAEQKVKRTVYNKERIKRPEVKEKMKAYRQRPEVKARMKDYRQERAARTKAVLARAKALGIS